MPSFLKSSILIVASILSSLIGKSQSFYANTGFIGLYSTPMETYVLNVSPCDTFGDSSNLKIYTCEAQGYDTTYNDVAIDNDANIWYVTFGGCLYKRKLNDTSSCVNVGKVPNMLAASLVADTAGNIYIAGNKNDTCRLFKYNTNGIQLLGYLPKGVLSAGDLFFYEHRLFMTCHYKTLDTGFITEIVIPAPEQSCFYMGLGSVIAYGAFTILENNKSRVFITTAVKPDYETSTLVELDMDNRKILKTHCTYPFLIRGAATYYERTGDTTKCPYIPKSVSNTDVDLHYLTVYNPSTNNIRLKTNLKPSEIDKIRLFDFTGKLVRDYSSNSFPNNLNISDVPDGLYLIQIVSKYGTKWNEKILKSAY